MEPLKIGSTKKLVTHYGHSYAIIDHNFIMTKGIIGDIQLQVT